MQGRKKGVYGRKCPVIFYRNVKGKRDRACDSCGRSSGSCGFRRLHGNERNLDDKVKWTFLFILFDAAHAVRLVTSGQEFRKKLLDPRSLK